MDRSQTSTVSNGAIRAAKRYLEEYFGQPMPQDLPDLLQTAIALFTAQKEKLENALPLSSGSAHPAIRHSLDLIRGALRVSSQPADFIKYINLNPENLGVAKGDLKKAGID